MLFILVLLFYCHSYDCFYDMQDSSYILVYLRVDLEKVYKYAERRIGSEGRDFVHDLVFLLPSDKLTTSYALSCIRHYRTPRKFVFSDLEAGGSDPYDTTLLALATANVRNKHAEKVDIFLATLESSENAFSIKTKISRLKIKNICIFVKNEIRKEYVRLDNL